MADENVTIKRTTLILVVALVAVFAIGLIGGLAISGALTNPNNPNPQTGGRMQVSLDDDPSLGDANAEVIVIEFSDFQCPFCRMFYDQTISSLKDEYVSTGKVRFVYRDFPLSSIHPLAQKSAEASECADEQGKFWEYHNKMFDEQSKLGQGTIDYSIEDLKNWATEISLDANQFNQCLDSGKYEQEVQKEFQDGVSYGVSGTPTFYIVNLQKGFVEVVGAQPYSAIKQVIDSELANA